MAYTESEKDSLLRERKALLLDYGFSGEEAEKIMQACPNENRNIYLNSPCHKK